MKHTLLAITSLLLTTPIISNVVLTTTSTNIEVSNLNKYHIEESKYQYSKEQIDNTVEYRIYIDTTNDKLAPADNKIDFNWGYQAKNEWYDLELPVATYKFKDFNVSNRNDLVSAIGSKFSLGYYYAFNMWDSWKGWKYSGGKNTALKKASSTISLKTEAHTDEVQYEKAGSGTEASRIQIRQQWENNELKIFLRMSVWYTWKGGSIVNHASLTKFSLTNIDNDGSSKIKFGSKSQHEVNAQSLLPGTYKISLESLFDNARDIYKEKEKNNWITVLPLFAAYAIAGPLTCSAGVYGYGYINLFSYEPLLNDLALIMLSGLKLNGELELINTANGLIRASSLYYKDTTNISHFIGQTQVSTACNSILYVGVSTLAYMYLTE